MKEILGNNLKHFMICNPEFKDYEVPKRTYKGETYEVWEVSEDLFSAMCDMSEEKFVNLAGEDAWWRSSDGSNLGVPDTKVYINGQEMLGWADEPWNYDDEYEEDEFEIHASCLTIYLCDVVGASLPRNIVACAMDLAKYNNMTMAELFKKYEG